MAFWLARHRNGQDTDAIQRFDPRFWMVNFPRPMMASVVTQGAQGLRVDCEFHNKNELAGLIWESEDTVDHPLLSYGTSRDYAHTVLSFRWRSSGVLPLDVAHGPTLTIEGRDANGQPRAWYIRLWNYAEGSPEDAQITLRFSELESGFGLPGELIHPSDIDRMFISLVPQGYEAGSTERLAARVDGWAELSEIACHGDHAMLTTGDIMVPPHGEHMATAYDDSFNQTPERLVRNIEHLGYRGRVVHYVGMSHFYRLENGVGEDTGRLLAADDGALCEPARIWHERYFEALSEAQMTPIVSLSYELFAENCPTAWQQIAYDGAPARTGWVPPSALLSPANALAMDFLHSVAGNFVSLAEAAGHPVLFQIGEPWWWVQPGTQAPCIYDAAALTAFGGDPVVITDMREPMDLAQTDLLDAAGALLAASTAALGAAVRASATGPAEILLLAFTPTILDEEMPELKRMNLPIGWTYPAFDRLQLEDYDWLTSGVEALRREAYAEADLRLGYPRELQDYLSGFVLLAEDADSYWRRIDAGLDEARARGIADRYVWALPQVVRDGYTRLPAPFGSEDLENDVNDFDDLRYPLALGSDASASPEFSTTVAVTASGFERRNALWSDARMRYDVGPGIRSETELGILIAFFRARHGPATGFRLRDPYDFSSNAMTGTPTHDDQLIGEGDGLTSTFPLIKSYGEQARRITRPDASSVVVSLDGISNSDWVLGEGGTIALGHAPAAGVQIRAGFLFDVPVRFAEDRLDISGLDFAVGEAPSVPLIELREAV